jgi:Chlorophyllase
MARRFAAFGAALLFAYAAHAQPQGITREMIMRQLPLEGAPLAVAGAYETAMEPIAGSPRLALYRPASLDAFPKKDKLPVLVWGNGGCALDSGSFGGYLKTIASHGYLVVTTASPQGATPPRATADDLRAALDWSQAEAMRAGSPLAGKIDKEHVAVMGVSCGGFLTLALADDPRVDTIGVFNSGAQAPAAGGGGGAAFPTTDALAKIHGPTLYLNGGEPDFMMATSKANFDAINHVPIFYGSRANAGHSATYFHPGGGEFANVAVAWLDWQLKGNKKASAMFVGDKCGLCTNPNWATHSKRLK